MNDSDPNSHPHRRLNPLNGEYVLVSPHRMKRPWQGRVEPTAQEEFPPYDPDCYLCPGNERAGGVRNPNYDDTFVFRNDFAALLPEASPVSDTHQRLLRSEAVRGECRVICFSPRHDLTLSRMTHDERLRVVQMWSRQGRELEARWRWVQVFENRGAMMGASNPHPHGQIWALDRLPTEVAREDERQAHYQREHGRPLLEAYAELERELGERVVVENDRWLAVVPYWAVWPFETLLLPLFPATRLATLGHDEQDSLARILGELLTRYDNLFETPFPYSMGWHGAPSRQAGSGPTSSPSEPSVEEGIPSSDSHWRLHAHFYPPLLRSSTVRKFMVGFELLGESQRDLTPEAAAERLRSLPHEHYRNRR